MKNIHVIQTDKPSRLLKDLVDGTYQFKKEVLYGNRFELPLNIYITNSEEIKDCYYFNSKDNAVRKNNNLNHPYHHKIILTTDQDLIKNGVQAIDDEFLEWFIKNPSCEEVEVKRNKKLSNKSIWDAVEGDLVFNNHNCGGIITQLSNDIRVHIISENGEGYMETAITSDNGLDTLVINNYKVYEYSDYKIIIPKEELYNETQQKSLETNKEFVNGKSDSKLNNLMKEFDNYEVEESNFTSTESNLINICIKCGVDLHNTTEFICQEHPKNCKGIHIDEETLQEWANKEEPKKYKVMIVGNGLPKQETLEEVAERFANECNSYDAKLIADGFIDGAKWQSERMYSEEEVIKIVEKSRETGLTAEFLLLTEQFKKK